MHNEKLDSLKNNVRVQLKKIVLFNFEKKQNLLNDLWQYSSKL